MNNFQLYKTNLLLGGQMQWDIVVDSLSSTLCVSDFQLSPISASTPFASSNDYIVKNSHQNNVKSYYSKHKGNFYNPCIDANFLHSWPIICNPKDHADVYSSAYDMGCKRSARFNSHSKQFEFFCPVWIEHLTDVISFKISVKNVETDDVIAVKQLTLSNNGHSFHDRFVKYFNDYAYCAGLTSGSDDVLNVKFKSNTATATGLNASTGMFEVHNLNNLVENLTSRERPLLESDSFLVQAFADNALICKQLFNFNLCFNISDIISGGVTKLLSGEEALVSVDVLIGDEPLEKRDFYTEYDFIQKSINTTEDIPFDTNVLSYLQDNKCVDLIDKNKFCQSICHWSLCDNPDYMFNVYDGFSGFFVDKQKNGVVVYENSHQYGSTPNVDLKTANKNQNSTGWITTLKASYWKDFYKFIQHTEKYKTKGTYIGGSNYINGIKYSYVPQFDNGLYVLGLILNDTLLADAVDNLECHMIYDSSLYALLKDDMLMLLTNNEDYLSFGKFLDIMLVSNATLDRDVAVCLNEICSMVKSVIKPELIVFNNGIAYSEVLSPSTDSTEVSYFKLNDYFNYVLRYDGKLKPYFTTERNTLYYKDYVSENTLPQTPYAKYGKSDFEPKFPSIGYCAIKKLNEWNLRDLPSVTVSEHDDPVKIYREVNEYKWFNNSKCLILPPVIKFKYVYHAADDSQTVDEIVTNHIKEHHGITDDQIKYVKNLYNVTNDWDRCSDDSLNDYVYNISLTLK